MTTLCQAIMVTNLFLVALFLCVIIIKYLQSFLVFHVVICSDASEGYISVRYEVMDLPVALPFQKPLVDKPNPKQGVGKLFLLQPNTI